MRLPEHVDAETRDDDRGDADASRAGLDRLEEDKGEGGDGGGEPWVESVDGASDEGGRADAEHAYETEKTNDESVCLMAVIRECEVAE